MTRKILFGALCALAVLSCTEKTPEIKKNVCSVETGEAYNITSNSVKLTSQFYIGSFMVDWSERTVLCSTESNPTKENSVTNYYTTYEQGIEYWYVYNLTPNTTYYFRAYLDYEYLSESETLYGKVKSFTTLPSSGE